MEIITAGICLALLTLVSNRLTSCCVNVPTEPFTSLPKVSQVIFVWYLSEVTSSPLSLQGDELCWQLANTVEVQAHSWAASQLSLRQLEDSQAETNL